MTTVNIKAVWKVCRLCRQKWEASHLWQQQPSERYCSWCDASLERFAYEGRRIVKVLLDRIEKLERKRSSRKG